MSFDIMPIANAKLTSEFNNLYELTSELHLESTTAHFHLFITVTYLLFIHL
jgi:hypothetical protein